MSSKLQRGRTPEEALGDWASPDAVAVAIPDATRPLDPVPALLTLKERLGGMRVVVGLGLHRRLTPRERAPLLPFDPVESDPDDTVPTTEIEGVPGEITRSIHEADWSLSLGVCELHQYAGLSGGHKGVAIGCGGRRTISALHARNRVMQEGVRLGQVEGNPFRRVVDGLGRAARCRLALACVPNVGAWLFGDPEAVVKEAASLLDPWLPIHRLYEGAVLHVPPAKGSSLYQASRAATYLGLSPSPPVTPGGRLVIHAPCPEGLGAEEGWVRALQDHRPPWTGLLSGPEPTGAGAQRAVMLALLARRYRLVVAGAVDPAPFRAVGFETMAEPPRGERWLQVEEPFTRVPQLSP